MEIRQEDTLGVAWVSDEVREATRPEICEYNPREHRASFEGADPGACSNPASVNVGADGLWHLCDSCADLPAFDRYKKAPLPRRHSTQQ